MRLKAEDLPGAFSDLEPVPQDGDGDGASPGCCRIDYAPEFVAAYDYFRAVLRSDERSDRALALTRLCLQLNPANYTVWHFRRRCLFDDDVGDDDNIPLEDRMDGELQLAAELGGDNPKNYQIWYHRRALLEELRRRRRSDGNGEDDDDAIFKAHCRRELEYLSTVARHDSKNYHAWSHRQ